jgi:hypothetical protein
MSKTKDTLRFQTDEIEDLLEDLKKAEEELSRVLIPFVVDYVKMFYKHRYLVKYSFNKYILLSLALVGISPYPVYKS